MFTIEKAFAKINLMLDIERKREDGYHDIFTIMQLVDLYDEVYIRLNMSGEIIVKMKNVDLDLPMEKNLAYIAAKKFYENLYFDTKIGVEIIIFKNIPVASGLGGGSADAGAVLRGLNFLYGKPFTTKELCNIGISIGSDVPFCIVGGVQACRGKGDVVCDIFGIQNYNLVLACGEEKESTAAQYKKLDEKFNDFKDHKISPDNHILISALISGRCREAFGKMYNIFESLYDENSSVQKIKKIMYENDANFAMLSGSGPTVFGVFPNCLYAEDAQEVLAKENIKSYICRPINKPYERIFPNEEPWKM